MCRLLSYSAPTLAMPHQKMRDDNPFDGYHPSFLLYLIVPVQLLPRENALRKALLWRKHSCGKSRQLTPHRFPATNTKKGLGKNSAPLIIYKINSARFSRLFRLKTALLSYFHLQWKPLHGIILLT